MSVLPYKESDAGKKQQVAEMFNNISGKYDLLNRLLSAGVDVSWRKKALKMLKDDKPFYLLDVATGTADFALMAQKILKPGKITGIDISEGMLAIGAKKIKEAGLETTIDLEVGDCEALVFPDASFDAVTVAFGVRNFEDLDKGLKEINRVLKIGGKVLILEFSKPDTFPLNYLFNFYFKHILPLIGKMISKDTAAYSYLPESVQVFPYGSNFLDKLKEAGFEKTKWKKLTFGISSVYTGTKF